MINHIRSLKITNLILQKTGTYNDMYHRPYISHVDQNTLNNLTRRVEDTRGAPISQALFSGLSNEIITPSPTIEGNVAIDNGWSERRLRFILETTSETLTGNTIVQYFQGYTNHDGVGMNGSVDPNMVFYINSFITLNRSFEQSPYGLVAKDVVTESAHVVDGNIVLSNDQDMFVMRPQDIFIGVQSSYLENAYNFIKGPEDSFIDSRLKLRREGVRSNRNNGMPSYYLSNIVNSYQTGMSDLVLGQGPNNAFSKCIELTYEPNIRENGFINSIMGIHGIDNTSTFTIDTLRMIDPDVDRVINYINLGPVGLNKLHSVGQTSYWNASDRETVIATSLANAVPQLLLGYAISKVDLTTTNGITGSCYTVITNIVGIKNNVTVPTVEAFKMRLGKELLDDLSFNNQEIYNIVLSFDLFGETKISLSLNNGPMYDYTFPSFSDSLLVPVMTPNKDNYSSLVYDFECIMNNIQQITPSAMYVNEGI
jgi:hypothetical protein